MGGTVLAELELRGVMLRHEPSAGETGRKSPAICTPAPRCGTRSRLASPLLRALRHALVMPAMGAYSGGLNLRDRAFAPLFRDGVTAHNDRRRAHLRHRRRDAAGGLAGCGEAERQGRGGRQAKPQAPYHSGAMVRHAMP